MRKGPRMYKERRDYVTRSFAVTAKRRGAPRFVAVVLHGVVSRNLAHIADVERNRSRGHSPPAAGASLTAPRSLPACRSRSELRN